MNVYQQGENLVEETVNQFLTCYNIGLTVRRKSFIIQAKFNVKFILKLCLNNKTFFLIVKAI